MKQQGGTGDLPGVTVAICCHNSSQRLPQTLAHLAAQNAAEGLEWEVLVIDNASTDDTAEAALSLWPQDSPAPLRVAREPQAGLSHARVRAFNEARYEIVSFIDDDNWVCPDWVRGVAEIMGSHPRVGACGGYGLAVCEVEPPCWFERFYDNFAIGPQGEAPGVLRRSGGHLWGAGMSVRKSAWQGLLKDGFSFLTTGRKGSQLGSGEDLELSYALQLAGWELYYEPGLTYQHYMPSGRLSWQYLRRLNRGFGASSVGLDPYQCALEGTLFDRRGRLFLAWIREVYWEARKLQKDRSELRSADQFQEEGDPRALRVEYREGRLSELLRGPRQYAQRFQTVMNAAFRRSDVQAFRAESTKDEHEHEHEQEHEPNTEHRTPECLNA